MKKYVAKLFLLLFVAGLSFSACNSKGTTPPPLTLNTPTAKISGTTLSWGSVERASGYTVDINGTVKDTADTSYSLADLAANIQPYQIKVRANGNGRNFADSNWALMSYKVDYAIPAGLDIDIYDGNTLLFTITTEILENLEQKHLTIDGEIYIAYAIADILDYLNIQISMFANVAYDNSYGFKIMKAYDDYATSAVGEGNDFENAYIVIGKLNAGSNNLTGPLLFLPDGDETDPADFKEVPPVGEISITTPKNEYAAPEGISVDVLFGDTLMAAITTDDLDIIRQKRIPASNNRVYIAYAISDIQAYFGVELPPFTQIAYGNSGAPVVRDSNNFDNAYISIGYLNNGSDPLITTGAPRMLHEGTETANSDVVQDVASITINPSVIPVTPDPNPGDPGVYTVPPTFSVDFFYGGRSRFVIDAGVLNSVTQQRVTISNNRVYIAYAIADILEHIKTSAGTEIPAFNQIAYHPTDRDSYGDVVRYSNNFDNAYISIGYLQNGTGALQTGNTPRILPEGPYTSNGGVIQNIDRITVLDNDFDPQGTTISIDVYDGGVKKAAFTSADLANVRQKFVRMRTERSPEGSGNFDDRVYVGYAIADILNYLGCTLSPFTRIEYVASDGRIMTQTNNSFANAYLAIGYMRDTADTLATGNRVLPNGWFTKSSGDLNQNIERITVSTD